jgi:hypothetical protein
MLCTRVVHIVLCKLFTSRAQLSQSGRVVCHYTHAAAQVLLFCNDSHQLPHQMLCSCPHPQKGTITIARLSASAGMLHNINLTCLTLWLQCGFICTKMLTAPTWQHISSLCAPADCEQC